MIEKLSYFKLLKACILMIFLVLLRTLEIKNFADDVIVYKTIRSMRDLQCYLSLVQPLGEVLCNK